MSRRWPAQHDDETFFSIEIDEEYNTGNDRLLPERKLLTAVLERALLDLKHVDRKIRDSALEWFLEDASDDPKFATFQSICETLQLDFMRMRSQISKFLMGETSKTTKSLEPTD